MDSNTERGTEPADTTGGGETVEARRRPDRKRRVLGVVIGAVVIGLAAVGVHRWWFGRTHVSTDDAQVDGHIVPVLPKVGGFVAQILVDENQRVHAGDTLVVLDDRDLRVQLEKADADLAALLSTVGTSGRVGQAVAQLSSARAEAAGAHAAVTQAEANASKAKRDLERYEALAQRNVVSAQQLDAAETGAASAAAQQVAAQRAAAAADQQVVAAEAALRGADARVAAARATRDQAALQLSYTRITAPVSGVVSKKSVELGQLVQAGQPLMAVVPLDDIWVVANLKETQVQNVRPGDPATVSVDAYDGRNFAGHVESLSPATGAKFSLLPPDNATGNFTKVVQRLPVRIRLDEPQDTTAILRPGMSVTATITTKH
ncbi:MAG TPA: HlyD family secretion protein [Gemmatimonadales bacterium]|nr:HlyD family secretion protein [Gemmatimonadales bacterium]